MKQHRRQGSRKKGSKTEDGAVIEKQKPGEGNLWRKRQENVSGWIMRGTKDPGIREKIILEYAPLVKVVAGRLHMYLGSNVEYEELVSYGIFGLIDAIDKFDFFERC